MVSCAHLLWTQIQRSLLLALLHLAPSLKIVVLSVIMIMIFASLVREMEMTLVISNIVNQGICL